MRKHSILMLALTIVFALGLQTVAAQFPIIIPSIPKIPKIKIPKIQQPNTPPTTTTGETQTVESQPSKPETASQNSEDGEIKDIALKVFLSDIAKAQKEVDAYTPEEKSYLVSGGDPTTWLMRAVSLREREEWAKNWLKQPFERKKFAEVLSTLAASAAKKIPLYKADAAWFKFRDAAAEKLLMNYFKNPATIKVHRIGGNAGWQIQKDNYGLLPSYRYKYANVYYRDSTDDHPYCRVATVTVKQDYAGGGIYSTEMYRSSAEVGLIGCPAGAK